MTEEREKRRDEEIDIWSVGTSGDEAGSRQAKHLVLQRGLCVALRLTVGVRIVL